MFATSFGLLAHLVFSTFFALRVLYRKLEVNSTLAWIIIIYSVPFGGALVYILFGDHRLGRKRMKNGERIREIYQKAYGITKPDWQTSFELNAPFDSFSKSLKAQTGFPVLSSGAYEIITETNEILTRMHADIEATTETCFLEFYIIEPEGRVKDILEALDRAAQRGVTCKILADSFGSRAFFNSHWPARLRRSGVEITSSLPVSLLKSFSKRSDLRNHRKILICDQLYAYIGSYNLVDPKHFKAGHGVGEWVDVMMRVTGSIVDAATCVFNADYLFDSVGLSVSGSDIRSLPLDTSTREPSSPVANSLMQLLPSGPEMRHSTIYEFMVAVIFNARESVRIITPYFIPDQAITIALTSAAKRGVDVQIIVPEKLDTILGRFASESSFEELLKAGVKLYKYSGALLHTKLIIIDEDVALFGTMNVDMRSFYLNLELTLVIYDLGAIQEFSAIAEHYKSLCVPLELEEWKNRSAANRFLENTIRLASPLL